METEDFSKLFPLFDASSADALSSMLSVAWQNEYPAGRAILIEDAWGNALYFILDGWVKVRRLLANNEDTTLAILGPGDFFGEMAILDQSPRSTDVVALTQAHVLSVPAQKFTQVLMKEPQLHYRMLQLMAQRLRQTNTRLETQHQPAAVKLAHVLVNLGQRYGKRQEGSSAAATILNIPIGDLADLSSINTDDATKLMAKLSEKGWVKVDAAHHALLLNMPQLEQLAHQTGAST
ncbi:Crp/Fnr family transcriptional regulator [Candidatus Synechococcus calcipolaris G9]|uniref:Crp/Fnr family transcriptional regulator n=1 Tax=Candidatus Synechococcus calcipolaris G9 TaxID=1497997 RepID=A0ABT6EXE9_9SYNE|nr:Crp/Fnr family transcriptional regulator [Candidatus Synechococcus calcipolaris]MDG2990475.1 Crp/Fnr family transcriptional regulator [Candidatus Synechococcus calcipolaris G9]